MDSEVLNVSEEKRFSHIDLMESIAIFFVVMYHGSLYSANFLKDNSIIRYLLYYGTTIMSTCVPLFFFANGYLLFSKEFDLGKHVKKIIRLVLLTFTWPMILMPFYLLIAGEPVRIHTIITAVLEQDQHWNMNYFWFIGALICVYVLFPALKAAFDHSRESFIFFTTSCTILVFGTVLGNQILLFIGPVTHHNLGDLNYPAFVMFNPFRGTYAFTIVYFCIGGLIYSYEDQILFVQKSKRNLISVAGTILCCAGLFLMGVYYSRYRDGKIWDVVWGGYDTVFTLFNVLFLYIFSLNYTGRNAFIESTSRNTLGIYFLHGLILRLTYPRVLSQAVFRNLPANILYTFFVLSICLFLCQLLRKIPIMKKLI